MKTLWAYLKSLGWTLLFLALCCCVCAAVFALYHLPLEAVGYAALLCAAAGLVWLAVGLWRYHRRHALLAALDREITVTLEHLPQPRELLEGDYHRLIRTLDAGKREQSLQMQGQYRDMMEYYTIWAHQIKTPIAAMRLLLDGEDSPKSRAVAEELQRIEQYVEMVLGYLRLDSESTDYVLRSYDLDAIVRQAVRKYAGQFIRKKLTLDYRPTGQKVLTDEKWLLFVIEQVLSNALKYTKTGSVTIRGEENSVLVISDTGIGIAPEDLPRVFERGYTGCNGRSDKKASGIGLYLCRRIMEQLGHGVSITSLPGQGTSVRLHLARSRLEVE